ncbi:MAG: drug/metabolite transporter (DMT)-like permease [Saprospiraceae bacterium]|jgi:drug/metabolite transporter (DMT)-like permease
MGWLLLCIFCNVALAVIFKGFQRYQIDNLHAIVANYFVCVIVASFVLGKWAFPMDFMYRPWAVWAVILALLFISGFNVMALSFQKSGVALTAIIQKMSLILPASFAIALYGEPLTILKGGGILLALIAVFLVNRPSSKDAPKLSFLDPIILLPLLTFIMSGIIEIILFYVEAEGLVAEEGIVFTSTCFGLAGIFGAIYTVIRGFKRNIWPNSKEIVAGMILGLPNFFSIYLLVLLLSKGWQGSVLFPVNSISILIASSIVGFAFYKENADKYKITGIALGILAIIMISLS